MVRVEVYRMPGCSLCDVAHQRLDALRRDFPFELVEVDVSEDPRALKRWGQRLPVIFVDGAPVAEGRLEDRDHDRLRRSIDRALRRVEGSASAQQPWLSPRGRRAFQVAFAALALLALPVLFAARAWDAWVSAPRLAEQALDVVRTDRVAPPFRHQTADGGSFALAEATGQVVFVNFWATWCPPCRDEMPSMLQLGRELALRHPGKFRMVAVSVDDGWEPVRDFFGGTVPQGLTVTLDTDQLTTRAYYCQARGACPEAFKFPETYVVDGAGRLVAYVVGPRDWSSPAARTFLESLIRG